MSKTSHALPLPVELSKLAVRYRKVDELVPYAFNARTHSDAQVAQLAASIREFGFTNPVLVDENGSIIAGHGRVLAARKLALQEVPTIELRGLTEAQARAYVLADNKLALNAGWDTELLALELERITDMGFDAKLAGFSEADLEHLLRGWEPGSEPDKTPANDEGMMAVVKIRCPMLDEPAVRSVLKQAIVEAGLKGVELVD
jgi:ParB-like chromosome segregation protein Spo0J